MPEISVIVPVYNTEAYVGQCLESVLRQTFREYEVIVVDDGSTDGSLGVCRAMEERFAGRMKLLCQPENMGVSAARNAGMEAAQGEYIAFLDSDDLLMDTALERLHRFARESDADVVHTGRYYVPEPDPEGRPGVLRLRPESQELRTPSEAPELLSENLAVRMQEWLAQQTIWHPFGKLFRREFLKKHAILFDEHVYISEDYLFVLETVCLAGRYLRIPDILYIYRQNRESAIHQLPDELALRKDIRATVHGMKHLQHFLGAVGFFSQNPEYEYLVLDFFLRNSFNRPGRLYERQSPASLHAVFCEELEPFFGTEAPLVACLFQSACVYRAGCLQILKYGAEHAGRLWMPEVINLANRMKKMEATIHQVRLAVEQ